MMIKDTDFFLFFYTRMNLDLCFSELKHVVQKCPLFSPSEAHWWIVRWNSFCRRRLVIQINQTEYGTEVEFPAFKSPKYF